MTRIFLIVLTMIPVTASAQVGTVRYSHTYPLQFGTHFEEEEATSEAFGVEYVAPATHATISRNLVFSPTSSLMYPTDKVHIEPGHSKASTGAEHIDTTFVNLENSTYVESRIIGAQLALVRDQLPITAWRISTVERVHQGHRVLKATTTVNSSTIDVWFAPDIPVSTGPGLYGGLPGLILILNNEDSGEIYTAESIDLGTMSRTPLPPVRGTVASNEKYLQLKAKYYEDERRQLQRRLRDIEEGRMVIIKRGE